MRIKWTGKASSDLVRLHEHLRSVAPDAAACVVQPLAHAPDRLLDDPRIGEKLDARGPADHRQQLRAAPRDRTDRPAGGAGAGLGMRPRPATPLIRLKRLKERGVVRVSCPHVMSASALMDMKQALEVMLQRITIGEAADRPYLRINGLEQELLSKGQLDRKYGADDHGDVIRQHAEEQ